MSNALKVINDRVKQLQKKHPNSKRTVLMKKAGAEYRAGKLGGKKKKSASRSQSVGRIKKRSRKRVGRAVAPHKDVMDRKKVDIVIGSVSSHISTAKKAIVRDIAKAESRKLLARKAVDRRKIQKKISADKVLLRKLM